MLGRRQRPAQDFIENPLSHPQRQSREAGSCMGAKLTWVGLAEIFNGIIQSSHQELLPVRPD